MLLQWWENLDIKQNGLDLAFYNSKVKCDKLGFRISLFCALQINLFFVILMAKMKVKPQRIKVEINIRNIKWKCFYLNFYLNPCNKLYH